MLEIPGHSFQSFKDKFPQDIWRPEINSKGVKLNVKEFAQDHSLVEKHHILKTTNSSNLDILFNNYNLYDVVFAASTDYNSPK